MSNKIVTILPQRKDNQKQVLLMVMVEITLLPFESL